LTLRDSGLASRGNLALWGDNPGASLIDYPEFTRSVGPDPYEILERVGLPRSCLRNADHRISADAVADGL
jgi:hypothetical protein